MAIEERLTIHSSGDFSVVFGVLDKAITKASVLRRQCILCFMSIDCIE